MISSSATSRSRQPDINPRRASIHPLSNKRSAPLKVLLIAHNHPHFFPGGAEIVAYDLFQALKQRADIQPYFLAAAPPEQRRPHGGTPFQAIGEAADEWLFCSEFDYALQSQPTTKFLTHDFAHLLHSLSPDVVHFHHTMRIGIEALQVVRNTLPQAAITYTLHEFILICRRDGQMVRKPDNALCHAASPAACHGCFPEMSPAQFKMREAFLKAHLQHVDRFISPSQFLARRFTEWGLPDTRMICLENGRPLPSPAPHRFCAKGAARNVLGYFGQINPYKGVMLLLEAAELLVGEGFTDFRLILHGNIAQQTEHFQQDFLARIRAVGDQVAFHGRYRQSEIPDLMRSIDWVVVPSTWWENSPLVIQESFAHRRPVICSDIGGMAEKVQHEISGLHARARCARSFAAAIRRACEDKTLWPRLVSQLPKPLAIDHSAAQHVSLYQTLTAHKETAHG